MILASLAGYAGVLKAGVLAVVMLTTLAILITLATIARRQSILRRRE